MKTTEQLKAGMRVKVDAHGQHEEDFSYGIVPALREIERRNRTAAEPTLLEAAKAVVELSGWSDVTPTRRVFQSSALAVEVLRTAIEREENPQFRLAPEPIEPGVV